jgi:hypothetical protein
MKRRINYKYNSGNEIDLQINKIISEHKYSTIFHEPEWNIIVSKYFKTDFFYWLVMDKNRVLGICPIHKIKNYLYSAPRSSQVIYGGWLFTEETNQVQELSFSKVMGIKSLTYWTAPDYTKRFFDKDFNKTFSTLLIDLDNELDNIWRYSINSKRRNMIRKALKNNIKVKLLDYRGMKEYYKMMIETNKRVGLKMNPKEFYIEILKKYFKSNKAVCMIAFKNGVSLSGVIIVRNRIFSVYWHGAGPQNRCNLGQSELLQWEAIKWSKSNGSKFYDLCYVDKKKQPHIDRFKYGFSQWEVPFYLFSKKPITFKIVNRIKKWF